MPPKRARAAPADSPAAKRHGHPEAPLAPEATLATSSPSASGPLPSFAALPLDIVQVVMALLPLRPRLLSAGLVCRRWSEAARRVTTSLPGHLSAAAYETACKRLPLVTSMCMTPPLPPCQDVAIGSLTTLTSLSVLVERTSSADLLARLLEKNRGSLTALGVHFGMLCTEMAGVVLLRCDLPALRNLHLRWDGGEILYAQARTTLTALMTKLSGQLQSLSLDVSEGPADTQIADIIASIAHFPKLERLSVPRFAFTSLVQRVAFRSAPQLTSVACWATQTQETELRPDILGIATSLVLMFVLPPNFEHKVFALSALTGLVVANPKHATALTAPLPRIRRLGFRTHLTNRFDLFHFFPSLTSLTLSAHEPLVNARVLLAAYVASNSPLRHLYLRIDEDSQCKLEERSNFKELVQQAERRGLQCMHVYLAEGIWQESLRAFAKKLRWLELIVELLPAELAQMTSGIPPCLCEH